MKKRYNYLQNENAVNEILKHKWLESQKAGRDIGFVAAAFDWIKKHGEEWQKANNIYSTAHSEHILTERRKYRRIPKNIPIKIKIGNLELEAQIKKINHIGIELLNNASLPTDKDVEILMPIQSKEPQKNSSLSLKAKVLRNTPCKTPSEQKEKYLVFTLLDKHSQEKIINTKDFLLN